MLHAGQLVFTGALIAADLAGLAAVQVGTKGGYLDHFVLAATAIDHVNNAKASANDEGAAKQAFDLLRRGIGGHVEVFRAQTHQQVAHGAANDKGLVARVLEHMHHIHGAFVDQLDVDAVVFQGKVLALAKFGGFDACGTRRRAVGFAKQFVDEFFDHVSQMKSEAGRRATGRRA